MKVNRRCRQPNRSRGSRPRWRSARPSARFATHSAKRGGHPRRASRNTAYRIEKAILASPSASGFGISTRLRQERPCWNCSRNGPVAQGSSGPRTRPACALAHRQRTQGSGLLMAAVVKRLAVFAYLDDDWAPAGLLEMTEEGVSLQASSFAYGLRYLGRPNAIEVDPVSLSLARKDEIRGKMNFPAGGLTQFGGIRDAAPDAWGRRVIEAKLRAKANALPESTYLLHAGSQRIGALDVRESLDTPPARRRAMACSTSNTWSIRRRASRRRRDRARRTRGHLRTRERPRRCSPEGDGAR